jgi:hypothetical protein
MYSISLDEPAPQTLTFPGDYRRPGSARTTRILTDDELWAVNTLAGSIGVSGPQLLAILLELTGARRNAYHSDGCYGISNLTKQQLAAAGLAGEGGVTQFVTASMHRQLAVTKDYLTALTPAVSGVIPVFFTLATGQPCQSATAASVIPGTTVTGADVATRIANRVDAGLGDSAQRHRLDRTVLAQKVSPEIVPGESAVRFTAAGPHGSTGPGVDPSVVPPTQRSSASQR